MPFKEYEEEQNHEFNSKLVENNLIKTFGLYRFLGQLVEVYLPKMFDVFVEMGGGKTTEDHVADPKINSSPDNEKE